MHSYKYCVAIMTNSFECLELLSFHFRFRDSSSTAILETLEDLIKDTKKGILVSRLWYIRTVDPQTLLYTGLTRDGTFYIENGKIKHPVKNFRFNETNFSKMEF